VPSPIVVEAEEIRPPVKVSRVDVALDGNRYPNEERPSELVATQVTPVPVVCSIMPFVPAEFAPSYSWPDNLIFVDKRFGNVDVAVVEVDVKYEARTKSSNDPMPVTESFQFGELDPTPRFELAPT
jgi:hypothetical protein